jgi:hypothetical protein
MQGNIKTDLNETWCEDIDWILVLTESVSRPTIYRSKQMGVVSRL